MPLNENSTIPGLKQIYHKESFFSSHGVIVMTTEIMPLSRSYIQVVIAFVSANNICFSYINWLNIAVDHIRNKMLHILNRYEIRPNKLTKYPQTRLLRNLGFCYAWQITRRRLQNLWKHKP